MEVQFIDCSWSYDNTRFGKTVYLKTKTISKGSITVYNNNWKLHQRIVADFVKESQFTDERGAKISQIR